MSLEEERGLTNMQLRDKYIRLARKFEENASLRKARIRVKVEAESRTRQTREWRGISEDEFQARVDDVTNTACAGSSTSNGDPIWRGHVAMNQWYTEYAKMYGIAASGDAMMELRGTIDTLNAYLRRMSR